MTNQIYEVVIERDWREKNEYNSLYFNLYYKDEKENQKNEYLEVEQKVIIAWCLFANYVS